MLADHRHCSSPYSFAGPPPDLGEEAARLAEQAKAFIAAGRMTRLPYSGERSCLKFDRRTSSKYRVSHKKAISQTLAWSDIQNGMHIRHRATANEMRILYTPEFSKKDDLLRLAIAQEGWDYARMLIAGTVEFYLLTGRASHEVRGDCGHIRVPEGFVRNREALESICNRATDMMRPRMALEINTARHVMWCDANGGYVALRNAVAYRAWRQAQDSATIAKDMGLAWHAVRQMLCRLCESARALGLETFPRHPTYQGVRN